MGSRESTERSMQEGSSTSETQIEANIKDQMVKVALAVAGVAVAWGISSLLCFFVNCISSLLSGTKPQKKKKMMKAPGKDGYIDRDDFEGDTASYFKSLRN